MRQCWSDIGCTLGQEFTITLCCVWGSERKFAPESLGQAHAALPTHEASHTSPRLYKRQNLLRLHFGSNNPFEIFCLCHYVTISGSPCKLTIMGKLGVFQIKFERSANTAGARKPESGLRLRITACFVCTEAIRWNWDSTKTVAMQHQWTMKRWAPTTCILASFQLLHARKAKFKDSS